MKFIKWKIFILTSLVCFLPVIFGVAVWEKLPDVMAIHFDINNNPDGFASRGFVVFGMPALMIILQALCCFINDINSYKHGERKKFERVTKWIIPVMSVILQTVTLLYGMGQNVDIRRVVMLIVGAIMIVIGNYLPKFDYIKDYNLDAEKARKINRFIGYETVVMGLLALVTIPLPPLASLVWIILLVPYTIAGIIYGIRA